MKNINSFLKAFLEIFAPDDDTPPYKLVVMNTATMKSTTTYFNTVKEAVDSVYPAYLYDGECDYMLFDNNNTKNSSYLNLKTQTHGSNTNKRIQSRSNHSEKISARNYKTLVFAG